MSAAKVRRMSPSSVAQDWVDRFGRGKGPETTFPFPNELPDHFPSPIYTSFNEKAIPLPTRDVRNSPISTASNLSQSSEPNSSSKCRQLPCRTFVSTGSCPYGDRCVFLHDPLIVSKPVFIKIKRKSKEDAVTDAFFWPTMPQSQVMGKVDSRHQPDVSQSYTLPPPGLINEFNSINDAAVYSMWEHFVDYLVSDPLSVIAQPRSVPPLNPSQPYNRYSGKRRLPVFMALCVGKPLSPKSKPFTVSSSGRLVQCR